MLRALLEGILAGYGIAIPVGPVGVLIVDTAIARGFGTAAVAGIGAASADLVYSSIAAFAGTAAAEALKPRARAVHLAGAAILFAIAGARAWAALRRKGDDERRTVVRARGRLRTYAAFFALTLTNPITVVYFASLVIGGVAFHGTGARASFVVGATFASATWQLSLAAIAAIGHHRLPERARAATGWIGTAIVIAFAVRLLLLR